MKTEFIANRQKQFISAMKEYALLYEFLEEKVLNSMVVPMPENIEDIHALILFGEEIKLEVVMNEMERSQCHQNSEDLVKSDPNKYQFVSGYGYTENDKMWRQHSWVIDIINNTIVETTVKRDIYFGLKYSICTEN